MHKIKLILLLILPLSVLGQDLGIIDTKTTKNPAINGTHRISTDGQNLFFRNFFGVSKKIANTDSPTFTGNVKISSLGTGDYVKVGLNGLLYSDNTFASDALSATQSALDLKLTSTTAASTYLPISNPTATGTLTAPTIENSLGATFATSSGNVGIGTTVPQKKLDVTDIIRSTSNFGGFEAISSVRNSYRWTLNNDNHFYLQSSNDKFVANANSLMKINSTGNVGIGTTTDLGYKLDINGSIRTTTDAFFATTSGNVGIGTNSPSSKLHVKGNLIIGDPTSTVADNYIRFYNSSGTVGLYGALYCSNGNVHLDSGVGGFGLYLNYFSGTGGVIFGNGAGATSGASVNTTGTITSTQSYISNTNSYLWLNATGGGTDSKNWRLQSQTDGTFSISRINDAQTVETNYFKISSTGNVGIGTSTPSEKLEISGAGVVSSRITSTNSTAQLITSGTVGQIYNTTGDLYLTNGSTTNSTLFVNNGAERMRIFANGNVGIGTPTDAGYKLNVIGGVSNFGDNILLSGGAGTNNKIGFNADAANYYIQGISSGMQYSPYSVGNFTFTSGAGNWSFTNGNVGIGTNAPTEKLEVFNGNYTNLKISANQQSSIKLNTTTLYGVNNPNAELYNNYGNVGLTLYPTPTATRNDIIYYDNTDKETQFQTDGSTKLRIRGNGNVLIGTPTDAGYKLDVNGTVRAGSTTSQSGALISARNTGNSFEFGHPNQAGYGSVLGANSGNGFSFLAFNAEAGTTNNTFRTRGLNGRIIINDINNNRLQFQRTTSSSADNQTPVVDMTIDGSGNVGIGTTSPATKLSVSGSVGINTVAQSLILNNSTGVYSTYQYNGTSVGDIGTSNQAITGGGTNDFAFTSRTGNLVLGTGSIERMRIFANGNIGVGTPTDAGYKLDVSGTLRTVNDAYFATTSGNVGIGTALPSAKLHIKNGTDRNLWFRVNGNGTGTELLSINDSEASRQQLAFSASSFYFDVGNVGIGTVAPLTKFHIKRTGVNGAGLASSAIIATDGKTIGDGIGLDFFGHDSGNNEQGYGSFRYTITNPTAGAEASELSITTWNAGANTERIKISSTGNVGIGTSTPNASSVLDITSTTQGVLFPRLTTTQISAIASPADGLTVYNTTLKAICFYDAGAAVWKRVSHSNM